MRSIPLDKQVGDVCQLSGGVRVRRSSCQSYKGLAQLAH
jgi:hypothetical protein